jgi:hypothetical protein
MFAVNKWNKKTYRVVSVKDKTVMLQREDGSTFEIAKSEYQANYIEKSA